MALPGIEWTQGSESHSSNWGKFYVKGEEIEAKKVKEPTAADRHDNHHSYTSYVSDVPEGTLFSIFEQDGNKRGTDSFYFAICVVDFSCFKDWQADYGDGMCKGAYRVIAQAEGTVKAPRLMEWWIDSDDKSEAYAEVCGELINVRGRGDAPTPDEVEAWIKKTNAVNDVLKEEDALTDSMERLAETRYLAGDRIYKMKRASAVKGWQISVTRFDDGTVFVGDRRMTRIDARIALQAAIDELDKYSD